MSGMYPNAAANAEDFEIDQAVTHHINSKEVNRPIGRVVEIDKKANKVWVQFPMGDKVQLDPSEIMKASGKPNMKPTQGSGVVTQKVVKLAESIVAARTNISEEQYRTQKMASNVAHRYATDKVEKLCGDILICKEAGMGDMAAYNELYPKYSGTCSDDFIRSTIEKVYEDIS
jgi:hypothetical protein